MAAQLPVRLLAVGLTTALALLAAPGTAVADKPVRGCPTGEWTLAYFPPSPPAPGENAHWDQIIAGLISEFGSLEAGLSAFGVATVDDLYAYVLTVLAVVDHNGDFTICFRLYPPTANVPDYIATSVDNVSNA
jgi:hypothetical protein